MKDISLSDIARFYSMQNKITSLDFHTLYDGVQFRRLQTPRLFVTMKLFFVEILFACLLAASLGQSVVKPIGRVHMKRSHCVNNNYYKGPNCENIDKQLTEIKQEIRALRSGDNNGLWDFFALSIFLPFCDSFSDNLTTETSFFSHSTS